MFKYLKQGVFLSLLIPSIGCGNMLTESVYRSAADKIVKIGIVSSPKRGSSGSGAFIDSQGTVLTCAHVVNHPIAKLFVKLEDGTVLMGTVIRMDKELDLALISTQPAHRTPYLRLGKPVVRGQEVMSFGSPLGLEHMMSVGFVENLIRDKLLFIWHSATIAPGSSGGPLVDLYGELVGVNQGMIMINPSVPVSGYYVAIDISEVRDFLGGR